MFQFYLLDAGTGIHFFRAEQVRPAVKKQKKGMRWEHFSLGVGRCPPWATICVKNVADESPGSGGDQMSDSSDMNAENP